LRFVVLWLAIAVLSLVEGGSAFGTDSGRSWSPAYDDRTLTAKDPDNFFKPALVDSRPLFAHFTTQIHGDSAADRGGKKFRELVAFLDAEDIAVFLINGLTPGGADEA
jgi:hypothetical protein